MVAQGLIKPNEQNAKLNIPPELERNYNLQIVPGDEKNAFTKMRDLKSSAVGGLVTIKGIVTRASDVKPCMQVAVYACDACGFEVYQVVNSK